MAVSPDGTKVYAADGSRIFPIDAASNTFTAEFIPGQGSYVDFAGAPPPPPAPAPTVRVTGVEVTQGIQDLAGSVLLVSGRRTFVRVYVQAIGPAVPGVTATLSGVGNIACTPGTCPAVGTSLGPLVPVNTGGTRINVVPKPLRNYMNDSFIFELPWLWTEYQSLRLNAVVTVAAGLEPVQSCAVDGLAGQLYEFRVPTSLKVQFVRMGYNLPVAFNGVTNSYFEATKAEQQASESFIRRTYPLSQLVPTADYQLSDAGLGRRVSRTSADCILRPPDQQDLCARDYIANKLAEKQAVDGFNFGLPNPRGSGSLADPDTTYALIPQVPFGPANPFFVRGSCCTRGIGGGPSDKQDYAAHEIGHFLGRLHPVEGAVQCNHSADDPNYPYFLSLIAPLSTDLATGLAGFDGGDPLLGIGFKVRPTFTIVGGDPGYSDNAGYCKPAWISDYTYRHLYTCLRAMNDHLASVTPECGSAGGLLGPSASAGPQSGDWLTVFGSIAPGAAGADFLTRRVARVVNVPPRIPGNHSIRLIGAGGATLADYPFTAAALADTQTPSSSPSLTFGQVVPFVEGTQEIRIVDIAGGTMLGSRAVSASPPIVGNATIQGVPGSAAGLVTVSWTASDPDGDPLTFDISVTRDHGESLRPLLLGVSSATTPIDTSRLGGGDVQFRVVATDGVHSAFADTPVFRLANRPPQPLIVAPGDEVNVHLGQLVNLEGRATDPQDGTIPDVGLTWSTPSRSLGSGPKLSITDLPLGANRIALKAANSLGLVETTSIIVNVLSNLDQPGPTLSVGPTEIGWQVQSGESKPQLADLNVGNSGGGSLAFTAQSSAPWLTLSAAAATAPAVIHLTAVPSSAAEGATLQAIVTLSAAGSPAQVIKVPVSVFVGNTFDASKTVTCSSDVSASVVVTRGGIRKDSVTGRYVQRLTLSNATTTAIAGPIALVLDGLTANAALSNKAGDTGCAQPVGPYKRVNVGPYDVLGPLASTAVVLEFANPSNAVIGYRTRFLAGTAP